MPAGIVDENTILERGVSAGKASLRKRETSRRQLIEQCAVAGSLIGLLLGVFEGMQRYKHPHPRVLLHPDVSFVILFLGPILDGLACGVLGAAAGFLLAYRRGSIWQRVAVNLSVVATVAMVLATVRDEHGLMHRIGGSSPSRLLVAVYLVVLLGAAAGFIALRRVSLRLLRAALVVGFFLSLSGIAFYSLGRSPGGAEIAAAPSAAISRPNIVLITLDTLRADHLSLYGYFRPTTPNIDAWAKRGVVFENAIAPTSWTLASHASIFTGMLPHQHGADWNVPLPASWWTLAEILASSGYQSAGFTSNLKYGELGWGLGHKFDLYDDDSTSLLHNLKCLFAGRLFLQAFYEKFIRPDDLDRRDACQINRDIMRWLQHRTGRPFYLFVNYFDVHEPYTAPLPYRSRFGPSPRWPLARIRSVTRRKGSHLSPADVAALVTGYDNCLAFLDNSVGELLDSLSRTSGWNNTIVIITSDHGQGFGEHGGYGHGLDLYREVLHVPLIVTGPGIPAGARVVQVVPIQNLFETVLHFAGMHDLAFRAATLERFWKPGFEPQGHDGYVVSELRHEGSSASTISLTNSEWQYLRDSQGNEELYRWVTDLSEKLNVATSPEYGNALARLRHQLGNAVARSERPWEGDGYLSALGGTNAVFASAGPPGQGLKAEFSERREIPIGAAQAAFPLRVSGISEKPNIADQDLLESLPYH
jgi:arylsulfatase A-like enzyme